MRRTTLIPAGILTAATLAAYANSLAGPFIFDDTGSIADNPTIRHLWPIWPVLAPLQGGQTVSGRPVLNLTLAINYALGGTNVWGYHAGNLLIHILAGLTLFGIVRRTLEGSRFREKLAAGGQSLTASATILAFVSALIWMLHPLQTESVTYLSQRAESLMGLFYLLTLYCFIRYTEGASFFVPRSGTTEDKEAGRGVWAWLSVGACLFGMGTKEVMVSAPVLVLLYDRTFFGGTLREIWRRRRGLYAGLAGTWLLLGWLMADQGGNRGGTSGFGLGIPWGNYALTQFPAVIRYLRLALWPHPLDFHYGAQWVTSPASVIPSAVAVTALLAATVWGLFRRQALGFAGAWFFAILAPTSLVPGMFQTMAEHRMYLALAPVVVVVVCGGYFMIGRLLSPPYLILCSALAAGLGFMTSRRNAVYRSELALWSDTVAKSPGNAYAQNNLGVVLAGAGRTGEAMGHFTLALQLNPEYAEAHNNLGLVLASSGRFQEAIPQYEQALRLKRDYPEAQVNLGVALANSGRFSEALAQYEEALQLRPEFLNAQENIGTLLARMNRLSEAADHFSAAVRIAPGSAAAHNALGAVLFQLGRVPEALTQYGEALRINPDYTDAHANLGVALANTGRLVDAIVHLEQVVRLDPENAEAHNNLAVALVSAGRMTEAIAHYERSLQLKPGDADVQYNLALALRQEGRIEEARTHFAEAARLGGTR